jgi:hypothetical protein
MGDITDHLEEFVTHGRGCQPVGIRDLGDLPHTGAASIELTQDCLSNPRRDAIKRKRLIHLHVTSYDLTTPSIADQESWLMMGEMGAFFGIQAISPTKTVEALGGFFGVSLRPVSGI